MSRKPYIVILKGARWVAMWRLDEFQKLALVAKHGGIEVFGPYASEAEAQDNLEGEPNPKLKVF